MAYEEASVASLGRSCKAKAKAKAKEPEFVREYVEEALAREAAEERRAAQCDAEFRLAWQNEAATEEDPWGDMAALESAVDNPPGSVVHADTRCRLDLSSTWQRCAMHSVPYGAPRPMLLP